MADQSVFDRLLPIFQDVFDRDDIELTPELSAADMEEWDSLSNIRLFVAIEQAFGVHFNSDEITSLDNVGEMVDLLQTKRA
jgi:acyl carrier protein